MIWRVLAYWWLAATVRFVVGLLFMGIVLWAFGWESPWTLLAAIVFLLGVLAVNLAVVLRGVHARIARLEKQAAEQKGTPPSPGATADRPRD